jgi:DNA-directed RNA polymerase specialized sigma24 family protein
MINSVVDEYFFMNENIYMKLIKNLYHIDEVKVDESFLSELNFNYSEIAKILQKDRRTIKSRIDKER